MRIEYVDHMGTDLSVVNAARVSFSKESSWDYVCNCQGPSCRQQTPICNAERRLKLADRRLLGFLARGCSTADWEGLLTDAQRLGQEWNLDGLEDILKLVRDRATHWTPFTHTAITVRVSAPIFVARQLFKHKVGFTENEVSRRYVDDTPRFYTPDLWRRRATNVKQGSDPLNYVWQITAPGHRGSIREVYKAHYRRSRGLYNAMLQAGVCPEQARMVLPQGMMTEWMWTGNLAAFARVFKQRTDAHAQLDTKLLVQQLAPIMQTLFPESWQALLSN